jgi:hypothetical protein
MGEYSVVVSRWDSDRCGTYGEYSVVMSWASTVVSRGGTVMGTVSTVQWGVGG